LSDGVLVKDNHLAALGDLSMVDALRSMRGRVPHTTKIEVEVDRLDQIEDALAGGADIVLLDNMPPEVLRAAVHQIHGRALTEASGGITFDTVRGVAETGVDLISVGALTHSVRALDIGLDLEVHA
jgi:nicotinate-nucleotide pyrophosphorylase (carboxylating)